MNSNNDNYQAPTKEEMQNLIDGTRAALKDLKANKELLTDSEKEELSEMAKQLEQLKKKKSSLV